MLKDELLEFDFKFQKCINIFFCKFCKYVLYQIIIDLKNFHINVYH